MSLLFKRVISGVGANIFGNGITVIIQLVSLPVFLNFWSLAEYGNWLMLSAIPVYFSIADVGMASVAMNKMTMLSAAEEHDESDTVFQSALALMLITVSAVGVISFLTIAVLDVGLVSDVTNKFTLGILIVVALANVFCGLFDAVFRSSGEYAKGTYMINGARLIEWVGGVIGLLVAGTFIATAIGMLIGRTLCMLYLYFYCAIKYPLFRWRIARARMETIRTLFIPALSFMAFPIGSAISIQGMTLLVGGMFGAVYLAMFSAYRTLSRVIVQLLFAINRSLWPEFSRLYGLGDYVTLYRLYRKSLLVGVVSASLVALLILHFGAEIIQRWTHGEITMNYQLFNLFVLVAVITSLGQVGTILLSATNAHVKYSMVYMAVSCATLICAFLLSTEFGDLGPVFALIACEVVLVVIAYKYVKRLENDCYSREAIAQK